MAITTLLSNKLEQTNVATSSVAAAPASPLIFDERGKAKGPGLHALIVGVSKYDFLAGGGDLPEIKTLRPLAKAIPQVSGPAQSAKRFADWLIDRKEKLMAPLRTLRLLCSPSPFEIEQGLVGLMPATAENVGKALHAFREDARNEKDVTLFYFAGHGAQRSKSDAVLLMQDFLGGLTTLDRAITVNNIYNGMSIGYDPSSNSVEPIAKKQLYFVDCCRLDYEIFRRYGELATCEVFDLARYGVDNRIAPIFYAAGPGQEAQNYPKRGTTRFGARLLDCLCNDAADLIRSDGEPRWMVTVGSLCRALMLLSERADKEAGVGVDSFNIDKWSDSSTPIHFLDEPPQVPCTFRFRPSEVRKGASIVLNDNVAKILLPPELLDPHREKIKGGCYNIEVLPPGIVKKASPWALLPPFCDVVLKAI